MSGEIARNNSEIKECRTLPELKEELLFTQENKFATMEYALEQEYEIQGSVGSVNLQNMINHFSAAPIPKEMAKEHWSRVKKYFPNIPEELVEALACREIFE